ncbi:HtaA domain-containing protein [Corynebacterium sp. P5848]|uniref:HtaA domain-containing protein n=1 Tax=Corynebacterium marambiense TaxID=2765364 RepID=UPI002260871E|nr:HtaA domain-containing protein [Corynebacterium marambiense]MCX7542637.1 HtaA domain-containing protein [Corynebacterium marambiense]
MKQPTRRLSRTGLAAVACLSMSISLVAPAISGADENTKLGIEHVASTSSYAEETPALAWGVLEIFRQASGGFDRVFDGATLHSGVPSFAFVSRTDSDDGTVVVNYAGTANVMNFCGPDYRAKDERGNCKLDLTLSEPTVTINPSDGTGNLSMIVHSLDKKTKEWVGPSRVVMANLDLSKAKYRSGETSTVRDIAVAVTEEGRAALSGNPKGYDDLDALNLSFTGPVTFGTTTGVTEELSLETEAVTVFPRGKANRLFGLKDGSVLHITRGKEASDSKIVIADNDLGTFTAIDDFTVNTGNPSALKSASDTLYWADGNTIRYADATAAGLGAVMELGTVPNSNVTGLAYAEGNDTLGVLTADPGTRKGVITVFNLADGTSTQTELPPMSEVRGTDPKGDGGNFDSTYGYSRPTGDAVSLRALPDGTFVYILDDILDGPDGRTGSTPLHIRPGQTPAAVEIGAAKEQFKSVLYGGGRRTASIVDGNIVFYNGVSDDFESVGVYTYSDGTFTKKSTADKVAAFDFITGATFDADGNLVMASAGDGHELAVLDPTTLEVISSTTVGSTLQYSNGQAAETLKFVGDDIFISGVNDFGGDETLTFIKVSTSGEGLTVGTSDDTLEVVELGSSDDNEPLKGEDTPATSTPATSTPATSTPATSTPVTSTPVTSTPATSTPVTSTPVTPDDHDGMSSDVNDKLDGLSGKLMLGSGGLSLVSLLTVGGIVAMIAALFHFVKIQFPGAFQFPSIPGMRS